MGNLQLLASHEVGRARRNAAIGVTVVAVVTAFIAVVGSAILIGLSLVAIPHARVG